MPFNPKVGEGDGKGLLYLQGLPALHSCQQEGSTGTRSSSTLLLQVQNTSPQPSKSLTSFQVSNYEANANRARSGGVLSLSPQSACSSRHSFSCLIYFILKGLSICITGTGWEKWVMFAKWVFCCCLLLLKIIVSLSPAILLPLPTRLF